MIKKKIKGTIASTNNSNPTNRQRNPSWIATATASRIANGISHTGSNTLDTTCAKIFLTL
ncbi:hypothetical protein A2618_02800 [Candidatus Collierbacteria bacterium RIFOXYD1_FULL_46_26]|uniref:Uncharacterized protein n=1 Tax=Candidatus Collierbacteria bacterium RIFOXYD1_FULL_46_26 TaxID=1817732 RepID=A0A1F5G088_9BACT|nr:MAG: hypothetical protein A2618_02800 [Candidatus Collierbacteria bacterium RIFOXYD1_FULL_46_26]